MGNNCCSKRKQKKRIVLLLVGLDNAGKTKTASRLAGDYLTSPVPTVGFSVINLKYNNYIVRVFDLGGGLTIRGIWHKYFVDAHGVIFVVDSSDYSRFEEAKNVLEDILYNEKIAGKPLLLLANKQDHENALDEIDIIEYLNIERLVNNRQCPTLVQSCSCSESTRNKLDPAIKKGYDWLMNNIIRSYDTLNIRVEADVREQEKKERQELLEKIERIKALQELGQRKDEDAIESYSEYEKKLNNVCSATGNYQEEIINIEQNEKSSDSSEKSSISFPPVYHCDLNNRNFMDQRPKSAVEIVKHQLQLNAANSVRRNSLKTRTNKTAPVNLYGVKWPRSADDRRRTFASGSRNLKSADEQFTISAKVPGSFLDHISSGGGDVCREMFQMRKLPPRRGDDGDSWVGKAINGDRALSVIDVE